MNDESHVNDPDVLLNAAYDGNYDLVEILLSQGADINACNNQKETVLFIAVDEGYSGVVELLLERGADPKLSDKNGDTALDIARYHGYKEIENILLSYGALEMIAHQQERKCGMEFMRGWMRPIKLSLVHTLMINYLKQQSTEILIFASI
ncbi:MAG: ankyrin repeat domain-containing protein [Deltaproteobacteria bacterium]|jgi:ankyrin repeat protein|nr:ankyrin repeat domain-containing protein [Deltaproteobacteria bacterium]